MAIKIRHDGQWVEVGVGSSVADGDYGDIIVSNSGATWTLDASISSGDNISEGDSKAEIIDTSTETKFTVEIDATEMFEVGTAGARIHRQDSSIEGGSLVFHRAADDVAAFELDVYGSSSSDPGRFRIVDADSSTERFAIGPNGQIGLSGANYGTSGQVLTSNGSSSAPTWQTVSGGGGGGSSTFLDEAKLKFGTDPSTPGNKNHQLQIWSSVYNDGASGGTSHGANIISSASTDRALRVQTNAIFVVEGTDGQNLIRATNPEWTHNPVNQIPGGKGSVELYYLDTDYPTTGDSENIDGIRLYTTGYGVSITGDLNVSGNLSFGGGNTGVGTTAQEEPVGTIIAWGGPLSSIPDNYQLCDGGTPQTSTLQDLLGTGANVPDLRDRFIIGAGNNYAVDATGGESTVTLTTNQIPSHHHNVDTHNEWSSTHGNWASATGYRQEHTWASYYKPETSDTGGGQAHNNMPPYYALCYIIKHTSSTSGSSSFTSGDGFVLLGRKSATGTSVEFTGIPANALEMTLMFEGVSGSSATYFDVQLGTSNGYITSNYNSSSETAQGTNNSTSTSSFVIKNGANSFSLHGSMIINKSSSNSYAEIGQFKRSNDSACECFGSLSSVSGVVNRLKVSIGNGNFDAGLIGLSYKTSGFGGGGSNSGIGTVVSIEDDGSPVGTASTINFGDNLEVGLSGGVATITGVGTFSGDYNDLENTPTIPTNTSDLNNDSGFIGAGQTFSGDYNDLTNVPQMFGIPSGGIIMWSGAENLIGSTNTGGTGTGWVLCDGQTYTVDGVSVTPPDLRNRFVVGAGSGGNYNVGDTGGSDDVTLSGDEMPSHDHGSSSVSVSVNSSGLTVSSESDHTHGTGTLGMDGQGAHNHNVRFYGGGTTGTVPSLRFDGGGTVDFATVTPIGNHAHTMSGSTGSGGGHNHTISGSISGSGTLSMSGEGGGQAHENRPPYYALCYIMKT